jgi:hypothetical protein
VSVMIEGKSRPLALAARLLDALTDPARRERAAAAVLLGYVALWTLYAAIAKGSQDIHVDMSEQFVLSRELAWGYPKHPPLAMVIVRAWLATNAHGGSRPGSTRSRSPASSGNTPA